MRGKRLTHVGPLARQCRLSRCCGAGLKAPLFGQQGVQGLTQLLHIPLRKGQPVALTDLFGEGTGIGRDRRAATSNGPGQGATGTPHLPQQGQFARFAVRQHHQVMRLDERRDEGFVDIQLPLHGVLQALLDDVDGAARLLALGTDLSPEAYQSTLKRLSFYAPAQSLEQLTGAPPPLGRNAQPLVTTLQTMGLLKRVPDWDRLVSPEPALRLQALRSPS